jgi:hypothetical protein
LKMIDYLLILLAMKNYDCKRHCICFLLLMLPL